MELSDVHITLINDRPVDHTADGTKSQIAHFVAWKKE